MDTAAAVINAIAFDATGADIIICTPAMDASASPTGAAELVQAFYAQRKVLAGVSPVFADMLELGRNEEVTQGLPVVQLNDSGAMMEILLRSISHKMDAQPDLVGLPLKMIMALWSASHRYQMSLLQNLVQTTVSLFAARKIAALETVQAWSEIYVRAIKFQVPSLRELALINLVRWKPDHWPVELLAEIDPFGVLLEVTKARTKQLAHLVNQDASAEFVKLRDVHFSTPSIPSEARATVNRSEIDRHITAMRNALKTNISMHLC